MENNISANPFFNETHVGPASQQTVILLSGFFFVVEMVGIVGNGLVIFVVVSDRKMRTSVTNMFIMNLAVADLILLLVGIPDLVQFVLNRGWLLSLALCKAIRYLLVVSLYASVMTLVAVCVERYLVLQCDSPSFSKIYKYTNSQTTEKEKKNRCLLL